MRIICTLLFSLAVILEFIATALLLASAILAADMNRAALSDSDHGAKAPWEEQTEKFCKTICQIFQNPKVCSKRGLTYDCADACVKMMPANSPYKFASFGTCKSPAPA